MKCLKPSECYYGIRNDPDYYEEFGIIIVEKSFWEEENCIDDRGINIDLPEEFLETSESFFEYYEDDDSSMTEEGLKKAISILEELGCTHLEEIDEIGEEIEEISEY